MNFYLKHYLFRSKSKQHVWKYIYVQLSASFLAFSEPHMIRDGAYFQYPKGKQDNNTRRRLFCCAICKLKYSCRTKLSPSCIIHLASVDQQIIFCCLYPSDYSYQERHMLKYKYTIYLKEISYSTLATSVTGVKCQICFTIRSFKLI